MLKLIKKYQEYIRDFGLNILATLLLTVVTSLVINPVMAERFDPQTYGKILALCSTVTVFSNAFGNSLNNVRLTRKKLSSNGYNMVILSMSILSAVVVIVVSIFMYRESVVSALLLGVHAIFLTMTTYYSVTYRIDVNYINNLIYHIVFSIGYLLGLLVGVQCNAWILIYIIADAFGLFYLYKSSPLFKEKFSYCDQVPVIIKNSVPLIISSFLSQVLLYFDRFLVYPTLGSAAVAEYSTAGFFGKSLGLVMAPIALVLLSYYANKDDGMKRSTFWRINLFVSLSGVVFFMATLIFAPFFTKLIYPSLYEAAAPYLFFANLSAIINIMGTMINPSLLKFCDVKWQMRITAIYGAVYLLCGVLGSKSFGLWGFAVGSTIANAVRLILMFIIGHFSLGEK